MFCLLLPSCIANSINFYNENMNTKKILGNLSSITGSKIHKIYHAKEKQGFDILQNNQMQAQVIIKQH